MRTAWLPVIRCSKEDKERVMAHAKANGLSYAQLVLKLIKENMGEKQKGFSRPEKWEQLTEITVLVPQSLRAYLEEIKDANGMTLSEQIRKILLENHGVRDLDPRELDELIRLNNQLVAVGRNLNQLTRMANSNRAVQLPEHLVARLLEAMERAKGDLLEIKDRLGI